MSIIMTKQAMIIGLGNITKNTILKIPQKYELFLNFGVFNT